MATDRGRDFCDFERAANDFEGRPMIEETVAAGTAYYTPGLNCCAGFRFKIRPGSMGHGVWLGPRWFGYETGALSDGLCEPARSHSCRCWHSSTSSHSPYANNPNAYFNRIRDNGFVSHQDARRRRAPTYRQEERPRPVTADRGSFAPRLTRPPQGAAGEFFRCLAETRLAE